MTFERPDDKMVMDDIDDRPLKGLFITIDPPAFHDGGVLTGSKVVHTCSSHLATSIAIQKPVCSDDRRWTVDDLDVEPALQNELEWCTPGILKSSMQKLIRTGCSPVRMINGSSIPASDMMKAMNFWMAA